MTIEVPGCEPAARVLGVHSVDCVDCPFPFCVITEMGSIRKQLRVSSARIIEKLNCSMGELAKAVGVSTRTASRYTKKHACKQCDLLWSEHVMCKSISYTVIRVQEHYTVLLNQHRQATGREFKTIMNFIDYIFPSSSMCRVHDHHDRWMLSGIERNEEEDFKNMCSALAFHTQSMGGEVRCLQTASLQM